jgi:peptidoglycan/xylan/chitin deacetylase (PgdA/CDA1 family)
MPPIASRLRVLNFHGIGTPKRTLDPGEADYWIGVDHFCQVLDQVVSHPDRERIAITFDDGNISDLTVAAPELQRRALGAEFFVLAGRIGNAGSLDRDDIRALIDMGMHVGSHGVAHRDWTSLSTSELIDEVSSSKAALEAICGQSIRSAAIPFGRYNAAVLAALKKARYTAAYSSDGGSMDRAAFLRPRTSMRRDLSDAALSRILSGKEPIWRLLRRTAAMPIKRSV